MLAFVQMSRPWVWAFAIAIVGALVIATIVVAAPNLKKHVDLVALALALWAVFYFYALLANQRGTISTAWLVKLKAAVGAFFVSLKKPATVRKFLAYIVGLLGALIANGVLAGDALIVANVIVALLTGVGIYSFSNAAV